VAERAPGGGRFDERVAAGDVLQQRHRGAGRRRRLAESRPKAGFLLMASIETCAMATTPSNGSEGRPRTARRSRCCAWARDAEEAVGSGD
jgi:hypothetical protein